MSNGEPRRIGRREALKWIAVAGSAIWTMDSAMGLDALERLTSIPTLGTDPDLINPKVPWPRTLTKEQLRTVNALCDVIIPEDDRSPAASRVGVGDFIDEWVSAPYPAFQNDRNIIVEGIKWIEAEAQKRFKNDFASLSEGQQHQICDSICYLPKAEPALKQPARFFSKMRHMTMGGFYTTDEGMKDIQYIGNIPMQQFDGPPPKVLKHLGLDGL